MAEKTKTYGKDNLTVEQMYSNKADAVAAEHEHYFTGKPCIHGHIGIRDAKTRQCIPCRRVYYQKNREKLLQYIKKYEEKNKDELTIDQMYSKRADAFAAGHEYYFTGKACKHGHVGVRKTKSGNCIACLNTYYHEHREERLQYAKKYDEANQNKIKEYKKQHFQNNKESYRDSKRRLYKKNQKYREKNKEKTAAYQKEYRKKNREKLDAYQIKYYENKKKEEL